MKAKDVFQRSLLSRGLGEWGHGKIVKDEKKKEM